VVETVIALSHAELTLQHLVALRNRVFEAYQEIMRLQL
jgi:flagellar hook-basal body complex protein FliE